MQSLFCVNMILISVFLGTGDGSRGDAYSLY